MRRYEKKTPPGQAKKEELPVVKPQLEQTEKEKVLTEIEKHGKKPNYWKRLFKKTNTFVYLINFGKHTLIIDPKHKIREFKLVELEEFCGVSICGGTNNLFNISMENNRDVLVIEADVKTAYAVVQVTVR